MNTLLNQNQLAEALQKEEHLVIFSDNTLHANEMIGCELMGRSFARLSPNEVLNLKLHSQKLVKYFRNLLNSHPCLLVEDVHYMKEEQLETLLSFLEITSCQIILSCEKNVSVEVEEILHQKMINKVSL